MPLAVALIGAGRLGARVGQALAQIERLDRLHIVEPGRDAAQAAREIIDAVAPETADFHNSIDTLPEALDAAFICTRADVRRDVIEALLSRVSVKRLVLEKVLFQRVEDFDWALDRLDGIDTFVHCPRRLWPGYEALKRRTAGAPWVEAHLVGAGLNIASNLVHVIDAFRFVSGGALESVERCELDPAEPANRSGTFEVYGRMAFSGPRGGLSIAAMRGGPAAVLQYTWPEGVAVIDEAGASLRLACAENDWRWSEERFETLLASQCASAFGEICRGEPGRLPRLAESVQDHRLVWRALAPAFSIDDPLRSATLPIT